MLLRRATISVLLLALTGLVWTPTVGASARLPGSASAAVQGSFQPDGWIKLCGQSLGCVIDPLPHPWLGRNVYNTSGRRQTERDDINEGEGIRYWITVQNDGSENDTIGVVGCRGNRTYEVNRVLLGKHKRQDAGATDLTRRYLAGTLTFTLDPNETAVFTINIITHFNKNVTYACRTQLTSQSDPGAVDVVVAEMTTF